jgi:hypothetical protein
MSATLANAVQNSELYETFDIPSHVLRANIHVGGHAQICVGGERFWVIVTRNIAGRYEGVVDNDLVCTFEHGLKLGDVVRFEARHVFQVFQT